ncbi:MAG: TerC family protein [Actinomycetaceae bacterium]|nr:TerC family protein [Actinomycetaceae bacterium]
MYVPLWEWGLLGLIVVALIMWDLLGHVRKPHEPTLKEAAIWSSFYIGIAIVYGLTLLPRHNAQFATEYFAGFVTEKALSLDNIFVFIIVIAAFKVPRIYQQKVLMWGIIIALVMRLIFILIGAAAIERFVAVFFIFGIWMLYTSVKQIIDGIKEDRERRSGVVHDDAEEFEPNFFTRMISKRFPVTEGYVGQKMLVRRGGKTWITPLFLCIVSIGSVDLLFAVDSIPAIFGLTQEPFIVFSANAFALLGLRQLFFLVDGLLDRLIYLHYGLAAILGFIGFKLILHAFHGYDMFLNITEPSPAQSVAIILGIILVTVFASIIGAKATGARLGEGMDKTPGDDNNPPESDFEIPGLEGPDAK